MSDLLQAYEQALANISAKDVQKIKAMSGKDTENKISLCLLYLFASFDDSLSLTNDKRSLTIS